MTVKVIKSVKFDNSKNNHIALAMTTVSMENML